MSLFYYKHFFTDKLLLEHVGLPHVLVLTVHLVNFFSWVSGWMDQGEHSWYQTIFLLKVWVD